MSNTGIVNIRGKEYQTVALRVQMFREKHPEFSLTTEVVARDAECVIMRAVISDVSGRVVATGHAEEFRQSSQINRTSALENAETSAIGRALAAFGLGGTEFATANEVQNAIHQQNEPEKPKRWEGRYPTKTALKQAMHVHHAELERLGVEGTLDDLEGYLTSPEYQDYLTTAEEHAAIYLHGGEGAPPEFIPTYKLETKVRDIIALRGNVPA